MAIDDTEWRILRELAKNPSPTRTLRARLSESQPVSTYAFSTSLSRLRSWGWLTGRRSNVTIYTITENGRRALKVAQQKGYDVTPLRLEQQLQPHEESHPGAAP